MDEELIKLVMDTIQDNTGIDSLDQMNPAYDDNLRELAIAIVKAIRTRG